jgi:hypothetical protein
LLAGTVRVLGLGSYQTAWAMLHRYRAAMVRPGRERLGGEVEVDETYVGGEEPGAHGRGTSKAIVVIAAEVREPRGLGRIRAQRVPDLSAAALVPFVCDVVEPGATVQTRLAVLPGDRRPRLSPREDGGDGLKRSGSRRDTGGAPRRLAAQALAARNPPGSRRHRAPRRLPERVHLPLQPPRLTTARLLFYRLLEQAVLTGPLAYHELVATPRPGSRKPKAPTGPRANPASLAQPSADRPWQRGST